MVDLKSDLVSPPYQLGLLVAYAAREKEIARNIDFGFSHHDQMQSANEIAASLLASDADLVAMSNYAWNYRKICHILDILQGSGAHLPRIVLGGPNCAGRFGADMMRRYPIISAIVEGEGEPAFRDICASLAESPCKDPFVGARNCRILNGADEITATSIGHRVLSLDEVPSPYLTGLLPVSPPPIFYETNRGCPYRCAFCYWGNGGSKIYRMSHERIREEMEFFARHRVSSIVLADANFGIFDSDAEVAEIMAEVNSRHGYPFRFLSVNYAKNSSDRVLRIASILRQAKIFTTATLALQSVSTEAEKASKRYAITTSKYVDLVRSAHKRNLPTYTDLILGMPRESIAQFLEGLEAAISTGVPAIKIHHLSLLPGTEFYDEQGALGLVLMAKAPGIDTPLEARSDYWDFLIHSHPDMSHADIRQGLRIIGINHLLHNHNLGQIVNFYLARYGVTPRQVYEFFDGLLMGEVDGFPDAGSEFLKRIRGLIQAFSELAIDSYKFEGQLSMEVWFGGRRIRSDPNEPEIRAFMHTFYRAFCRREGICGTPEEAALLGEFIDYNMLVSPKPRWKPAPSYIFTHDVHAIWADMLDRILEPDNGDASGSTTWQELNLRVSSRLAQLLTDDYCDSRLGPVTYVIENPMPLLPPKLKTAWAVTNQEWFCRVKKAREDGNVPAKQSAST